MATAAATGSAASAIAANVAGGLLLPLAGTTLISSSLPLLFFRLTILLEGPVEATQALAPAQAQVPAQAPLTVFLLVDSAAAECLLDISASTTD